MINKKFQIYLKYYGSTFLHNFMKFEMRRAHTTRTDHALYNKWKQCASYARVSLALIHNSSHHHIPPTWTMANRIVTTNVGW